MAFPPCTCSGSKKAREQQKAHPVARWCCRSDPFYNTYRTLPHSTMKRPESHMSRMQTIPVRPTKTFRDPELSEMSTTAPNRRQETVPEKVRRLRGNLKRGRSARGGRSLQPGNCGDIWPGQHPTCAPQDPIPSKAVGRALPPRLEEAAMADRAVRGQCRSMAGSAVRLEDASNVAGERGAS